MDPAFADVDVEALAEDMEGATFFIDQGLYEEAISELRELIDEYGEHPHLMARIESVKALLQEEGGEGSFDLDLDAGDIEIPAAPTGGGRMNIPRGESDAFQQFKDGVAKQVGEDDAETHFDVGIAYKEMGMFRDAISEFQAAMRPHNEVQCHVMIAHCHRDQGDTSEAINEYKTALYCEQISENEQVDLYYQMGVAYEGLDDPREAVYYYDKVARMVAGYRDVDARLAALQARADPSKSPSQNDVDSAFDELINADKQT
jgi:tetratricopeptide (TPR) repeat protein